MSPDFYVGITLGLLGGFVFACLCFVLAMLQGLTEPTGGGDEKPPDAAGGDTPPAPRRGAVDERVLARLERADMALRWLTPIWRVQEGRWQ